MTANPTRAQGTEAQVRAEPHVGDVVGLLLLRLGLGGVLVWFGAAELHSPGAWTVYVPHMFHAVQTPLMFVHATALLVAGAFLAVGLFHRLAAWLGGLILLAILGALILTGAVDSVFVRDIGLAAGAFALALSPTAARLPGVDRWLAARPQRSAAVPALSYAALLAVVVGVLAATSVHSSGSSQALGNLGGLNGPSSLGTASGAASSTGASPSASKALGGLGGAAAGASQTSSTSTTSLPGSLGAPTPKKSGH